MKIYFKDIFLIPNLLSLFRLLLFIPIQIFFNMMRINSDFSLFILATILVAFISDLMDGFIARKTNKISELGKIIDPLADKVLMAFIIVNLFLIGYISAYYFWIIILRDVLIFTGGIIVSKKMGKVLPSNKLGKLTVFSIGIFIILTLLQINRNNTWYQAVMYLSLIFSFASVAGYFIRAVEIIRWKKNETV